MDCKIVLVANFVGKIRQMRRERKMQMQIDQFPCSMSSNQHPNEEQYPTNSHLPISLKISLRTAS